MGTNMLSPHRDGSRSLPVPFGIPAKAPSLLATEKALLSARFPLLATESVVRHTPFFNPHPGLRKDGFAAKRPRSRSPTTGWNRGIGVYTQERGPMIGGLSRSPLPPDPP